MLEKVERLISEINRIHLEYSKDYFETGKVEKVNLKHTFTKVPIQPIRAYRLNLHEAINDYLMRADVKDIACFIVSKHRNRFWIRLSVLKREERGTLLIPFSMISSVPV